MEWCRTSIPELVWPQTYRYPKTKSTRPPTNAAASTERTALWRHQPVAQPSDTCRPSVTAPPIKKTAAATRNMILWCAAIRAIPNSQAPPSPTPAKSIGSAQHAASANAAPKPPIVKPKAPKADHGRRWPLSLAASRKSVRLHSEDDAAADWVS
jgi:hypothetical protein